MFKYLFWIAETEMNIHISETGDEVSWVILCRTLVEINSLRSEHTYIHKRPDTFERGFEKKKTKIRRRPLMHY